MGTTTRRPIQPCVDAVMRRLLRSPLHGIVSKKIMLLEVTGRRSGTRYRIPIAYGEHGEEVLTGVSRARWLRNHTPERPVVATVRGRRRTLYPELVTDEETAAALYPYIVGGNRAHARFQRLRVGPDGSVDRDDLRTALARGLTVVRLRPA